MVINKEWSVLTIGDGDLSFSRSIFDNFQPKKLTATVLDSVTELTNKYGSENLDYLQQQRDGALSLVDCQVITEFDITNSDNIHQLTKEYDLVIFQFPLVPNFTSQNEFQQHTQADELPLSINTINRRLLRLFLVNSFDYLLAEDGAQLAYISSKDVKPYTEWDIEYSLTKSSLTQLPEFSCVGTMPFVIEQFPGYKIRNVDRDKHVKDTASLTYVWTSNKNRDVALELLPTMNPLPTLFGELGCDICHAGPFETEQEKISHLAGKKHKRMSEYEVQWQGYLLSL
ncbi:Rossmann-like fold-containing protein [uncultured Psychrosphaera sp.]|uniref:Rossmann-like fold-containing protein n=1 Tax=uncultured Psychrosphaera sp. TaxID=1403522 RepID=UPI0026200BBA|nr:Rossmann-like fold-containing protein [uncultured Psychrosphaera sp.]